MFPTLNIFGASLPTAPFSIIIGVWIGLSLTEKYAHKFNLSAETTYNLAFYSLFAGIIGARITFILKFTDIFIQNPASIISANLGLFDLSGGIAFAILFAIIYGQKNDFEILPALDGLTLFFATIAIAISIANFAAGSSYGIPTEMPWAINLWGENRHPTQIYSLIGSGLILWKLLPTKNFTSQTNGKTISTFIIFTSFLHILISTFIGSPIVIFESIRLVQLWWFSLLIISLYSLNRLYKTSSRL
jgi:phosphatidylglycerol---prolipoprotein diacylglyceryl transferase